MQLEIERPPIAGLLVLSPRVFGDARGFFLETYHRDDLAAAGVGVDFVQDNHSRSGKGVLRGLHFQQPHPQAKLVRVTRGAVYDVAVDLRAGSPTYGQHFGVELSAHNHKLFYLPVGFAHGFLTLSEVVDFEYKCSDYYHPEHEGGVAWDDPALAIPWPLQPGQAPQVSDKDRRLPRLADLTPPFQSSP